jgi:hypothetical protein
MVTAFEYNDFGKPTAEKWLSADGKVVEIITRAPLKTSAILP